MTNNIITLGYTYAKLRLKNPPDIFCKIAHIGRLIVWIPSSLFCTPTILGRVRSLINLIPPNTFTVTNNQKGPKILTPLHGKNSGTQDALTPSTPIFISKHSTNPYKSLKYRRQWHLGEYQSQGDRPVVLELEYDTSKLHNLNFEQFYYFPGVSNLLASPHKWARYRVEDEVGREVTYLKVMLKCYILVWNNGKSQNTIFHDPVCALLETSINQGQEGLTKFYSMLAEFFRESDRAHACPVVATPHQREEWTYHPRGAVVIKMEESDL